MSCRFILLVIAILGFAVLTAIALAEVGYVGIFEPHFQSWGAAQVFVDLVILAVLACLWMVRDAPAHGLSAWPFVVITLLAGSFGPLLYLATREVRAAKRLQPVE